MTILWSDLQWEDNGEVGKRAEVMRVEMGKLVIWDNNNGTYDIMDHELHRCHRLDLFFATQLFFRLANPEEVTDDHRHDQADQPSR
jgi:hypothetical protein